MRIWAAVQATIASVFMLMLAGCGGGGGGSSPTTPPPTVTPAPNFQITTASILPGTLQNRPYTATLTASGGTGALKWSIAPISPTASFVDGLSIDATTGVLSGMANFGGTCGFTATVTDSASHIATKSFTISASTPLIVNPTKASTVYEYQDVVPLTLDFQGGVQPFNYTFSGGSLPPGLRLDSSRGIIVGSSYRSGTYIVNFTITDSYTPVESGTQQLTIVVNRPPLQLGSWFPSKLQLNKPFSAKAAAVGGTPPYNFSVSGGLPPGLAMDPGSGTISGTPNTTGSWVITVSTTDSSSPQQNASQNYAIYVNPALGRNNTIQNATPISDGQIQASISPYIDSPNGPPTAGDQDYYKLISLAGSVVRVVTFAQQGNSNQPLDTVLEFVDGNGVRLTTCRQPNDTTTNFLSSCINDDIGGTPYNKDSSLDLKVPGTPSTATTFYAHVLDWRGDARPDMIYYLDVSGTVPPLGIQTQTPPLGTITKPYWFQLSPTNSTPPTTWSVVAGSLPPGVTLSSGYYNGTFGGTPTALGSYPFTVQVTDSSTPPQTATGQFTIQVGPPIQITSTATWPNACVNQPYSFTPQSAGGVPPLNWSYTPNDGQYIFSVNSSAGVFSATPTMTGTINGMLLVIDNNGRSDTQLISLTVQTCP